ncbi:MAG TPA: hypothetical protein VK841_01190 [Polyangiaceae bacterium]|nr:hypothetical protein [Polyangiaceae bacterium]
MRGSRFRIARLVRILACPLVLALPPLVWVVQASRHASFTALGRDQGIFQYVAWALAHGAVDYRDVRDVNGPLTHFIHRVFLAAGGGDEHWFRTLDLAVTGASFAFVGACVPGLGRRREPAPVPGAGVLPHASSLASRRPLGSHVLERSAWALAGWVALSGQYLAYKYWDLAQRESFFDWFLFPSVALQLVAQARRRPAVPLAIVGALSVIPWFGKPTYALFTMVQITAIVADGSMKLPRLRALAAFATGGAAAAVVAFALLLAFGDARAYAHIQLVDVPAMYRFIWPRTAAEILALPWASAPAMLGFTGAALLLALMMIGELPVRALAVALLPLAGLAGVIAQAKGFPYHLHPVTAAVTFQWLVFCGWLTERARVTARQKALVRLAPIVACGAVALHVASALADSPHARADWILTGPTPEQRTTRAYWESFAGPDFFPYEMREAAAYLRAHTESSDRVQTYGMDPYVLFLAERLSATPYIYAYDLNADTALAGGDGARPTPAQKDGIRRVRDAHEADLYARVTAVPPAAFVFFDGAPLLSSTDAWDDFEVHCPRTAAWVDAHYRETARFGHDRVWLREDRIPAGE